jgi:hypothetical protein
VAYTETRDKINAARLSISDIVGEIRTLQANIEPEPVADYPFQDAGGPVRLADLFGDHDGLLDAHNMGSGCTYCTL